MSVDARLRRLQIGAFVADAFQVRYELAPDDFLVGEVAKKDPQQNLIARHRSADRLAHEFLEPRLTRRGDGVDLLIRLAFLRQRLAGDAALFAQLMQRVVDLRAGCVPDEKSRAIDGALEIVTRRRFDGEQAKESEPERHVTSVFQMMRRA